MVLIRSSRIVHDMGMQVLQIRAQIAPTTGSGFERLACGKRLFEHGLSQGSLKGELGRSRMTNRTPETLLLHNLTYPIRQ